MTKDETKDETKDVDSPEEVIKMYTKRNDKDNVEQLELELKNREELGKSENDNEYLYPNLDDPNFNIKIGNKKEFSDTKYDGSIYNVEEYAKILKNADYELLPQQAFVRNFLSFQTPYNSLLLFHGLGSGKTCSAIGVCEEMRDYLKQMGINKRIIIVASPNVQDNFKLQLFDERKLKEVDGIWSMKGCLGNKMLKEINPTGMKGLKREKIIQQVKNLINTSYSFQGYVQFSNKIVQKSGKPEDSMETKIRNLEIEYSNSLVVIDEVHNIRISDDNENKNVAKNLMFLVSVVSNIRLLLLSATPMFNSYKEIVWLLNLMNMNDRRGIISVSDIFDKNGNWKIDKDEKEIGKEMLIRKATGYVSYVRGENPYTFPFRVYPDRFSVKNTFKMIEEYPKYQINGRKIPDNKKITKLNLFVNKIGEYQEMGYQYIIDRLRSRGESYQMTKKGTRRNVAAFSTLKSFGYTDLQIPIESLNIVYPYDGLDELVKRIEPLEYNETEEKDIDDISPTIGSEKDITEEIDDVISNGPQSVTSVKVFKNSELESEPAVTEGIEADKSSIDKAVELDTTNIKKLKKTVNKNPVNKNSVNKKLPFDYEEEEIISKPSVKKFSPQELSFKGSLTNKTPTSSSNISALHIIETKTKSQFPSEKNSIKETKSSEELSSNSLGGSPSSSESSKNNFEQLYIDPKDLTGSQGLKRIMDYVDSKTPSIKGQFEYKRNVPHVFEQKEIGKYSSKIKNICNYIYNKDTGKVSDGIILIYSSYIDAGIIPMALALEEMGFTRYGEKINPLFKTPPVPVVDVRTMNPPVSKKDFKPARYIMITGDPRISPNNDADVKAITNNDNIFREDKDGIEDVSGEIIKVVLISQAGSEGLDFKAIRQVHILEPWYNVNRLEQIIGRAVRNFSHKDLPFSKRNVQIFLYGTILTNEEEEAVDLYIYRTSELKAVKIGKVTRLLKQTAVDCIINHDQTELISKNFNKIEENTNITQVLSDHKILNHFVIGDTDNTATCDFMECEFKCLPENVENLLNNENTDTYNETFMLINSDKIIQKIKILMKMEYFYKKNDLLKLINKSKEYPIEHIYAALTQIINDSSEYIVDKYGRTGYLVNIGDYYLFQPSELNYKNISIYDRSVPINYKHNMIKFEINTNAIKPVIDKRGIIENENEDEDKDDEDVFLEGKNVLDTMFNNYLLASNINEIERGNDNWYHLCGVIMRRISEENNIIEADSKEERVNILENFLIEHIVDSLMMNDKVDLLNYIYANKNKNIENKFTNQSLKKFYSKIQIYLQTKFVVAKGITGIVIFDGPSRVNNLNIFILDDDKWIPAKPEDKRDLGNAILKKYKLNPNLNHYVGFIGFENNNKYMVCQIKDTTNERSTGFRCDQAGKNKIISILHNIDSDDRFTSKVTSKKKKTHKNKSDDDGEGAKELYVRVELTLRIFESQKLNNKTWFVDTETAIVNEFQKKEKGNK